MRRAITVLLAVVALGVIGLLATALVRDTPRAFTLGVANGAPVVTLRPGHSVCQRPILVPDGAGFERVRLSLGTFRRPGPALAVTVRSQGGDVLARGGLPAGYPDVDRRPSSVIGLGHVPGGSAVAVCVTNRGGRRVAIYGNADGAARGSSAYVDGRPAAVDLNLSFERRPRSLASLVPRMLDRAALFRSAGVGVWMYVLLGFILAAGVPALLVTGLRSTSR